MAKKTVVAELPSASRGRKKLARSILTENFKESYPEETKAAEMSADAGLNNEDADLVKEVDNIEADETQEDQKPTKERSEKKAPANKRKNIKKKAKTEDIESGEIEQAVKEFTTLNCLKPTHARIAVVSALLREPVYKILEEALNDYVTKQKKSGKITFDI